MQDLRRRNPFKASEEEQDSVEVLDEQQQDQVIHELRVRNEVQNHWFLVALRVILCASTLIQVAYIRFNPILAAFPTSHDNPTLPLRPVFALVSTIIHASFSTFVFPDELRRILDLPQPLATPSFLWLYAGSLLAPTLALCLQKPWQTTLWWLITPFMVNVTQTFVDAISEGTRNVEELERLRYVAPGA